jgi:hypothetical protein
MKKILILLIAVSAFATVHAQSREETRRVILGERKDNGTYDNRNDRDVVLGRNGNDRNNGEYSNDRRYQVDQVNREYDNKINSIRNNPHLNGGEKERVIRQLEQDRQRRIAEINRNNNDRYDRNDRRYDRDERYARNGNGNKRGWEIGRGNPHRDDDRNNKNWKNKRKKNKNRD